MGQQDKKEKSESLFESFARLGRAKDTVEKGGDLVGGIQKFAQSEIERKRKAAEEEAKAKTTVNTAPEDGFLTKMYKKYVSGGK